MGYLRVNDRIWAVISEDLTITVIKGQTISQKALFARMSAAGRSNDNAECQFMFDRYILPSKCAIWRDIK